jgi:hypothetical protein
MDMSFDPADEDDMNDLVRSTKREPPDPAEVQIQLVVGDSRHVEVWRPIIMRRHQTIGWSGDWEGHINGQYVGLTIHLPRGGLFDVQE